MNDRRLEGLLREAFEDSADALALAEVDASGVCTLRRVNTALADLTGRSIGDLVGAPLLVLADPGAVDEWVDLVPRILTGRRGPSELRCRRSDGTILWVALTWSAALGLPREGRHALVRLVDVTQQHAAVAALDDAAHRDPLTGVLNRAGLQRRVRGSSNGSLLFCDLDALKRVNDAVGHDAGDEVLRTTAGRLESCVRSEDVVARLGGDEFVVVAFGVEGAAVTRLVHRIRTALAEPIPHNGAVLHVSVSIGVATLVGGRLGVDEALRQADAAMYAVKRNQGAGARA